MAIYCLFDPTMSLSSLTLPPSLLSLHPLYLSRLPFTALPCLSLSRGRAHTRMRAALDFVDMMKEALSLSVSHDQLSTMGDYNPVLGAGNTLQGFEFMMWLEDDAILEQVTYIPGTQTFFNESR